MADPAARPTMNPLAMDSELFFGFMDLVDEVVAEPEIRTALAEHDLTPTRLRMTCAAASREILGEVVPEYQEYVEALADYEQVRAQSGRPGFRDAADTILRAAGFGFAVVAAATVGTAVIVGLWWESAYFVVWPAAVVGIVGVMAYGLSALRGTQFGFRLLGGMAAGGVAARLDLARSQLLEAAHSRQMLAYVRTHINRARQSGLDQEFAVVSSPGLSEVYDSVYHVPTVVQSEMRDLVSRLTGGSIGIAGVRGSGKSTLVRQYCDDLGTAGNLRCMVAAPVDYDARDFVLHLFATFCRSVHSQVGHHGERRARLAGVLPRGVRMVRQAAWIAAAAALFVLAGRKGWGYLGYAGATIVAFQILRLAGRIRIPRRLARVGQARAGQARPGPGAPGPGPTRRQLMLAAERNLQRVRYLQTHSTGWTGGLKLARGLEGQRSSSVSKAEQPFSYPEIVADFRSFARDVARYLHHGGHRVFIGVDELDKIGSAEQAERFLNEIKGIFGIPHTYFLVSVSDDALTSFERRGLPLRDAFDSSFDEIIRVEPLSYPESRRVIYRRVIGLTEPYIAFCHCLSGGLARDLIRAARQVVGAGGRAGSGPAATLGEISGAILTQEAHRKVRAAAQVIASLEGADHLLERLYAIIHDPAGVKLGAGLVRDLGAALPEEPVAAGVGRDLVTYLYFCVTLEEVFVQRLDETLLLWATAEGERHPGHFDALAATRLAFANSTRVAWHRIDTFRAAWSLDRLDRPWGG